MKQLKVLYFIEGRHATPEEIEEGSLVPAQVGYRNTYYCSDKGHIPEQCDAVMGKVPKPYQDFPDVKDAIAERSKELSEAFAKSGDIKAPKTSKSKKSKKSKAADLEDQDISDIPSWSSKIEE